MSKYAGALVGLGVGAVSTAMMMSDPKTSNVITEKVKFLQGGTSASKFCLNVNLYVKPERRVEFIACIKNNQTGTMTTEPLAIRYDWGESTTEPNTFHFHEMYEGKPGFEAHAAAPHFAVWEEFASTDPFTREPEVVFYELN